MNFPMSSNFVIRHILTAEQYNQYIRLFFSRMFRLSRSAALAAAVLCALAALIWNTVTPLLVLCALYLIETFALFVLRAFLFSDYALKKYGQASVRYVFSEDSVQIISSAREHSQMVSFNAFVRPVETADTLYLLTLNPFVVIVLPKFAFSPDSLKELRASVEKKTGKEIAHA